MPKIIIVEDEPTIRRMYGLKLKFSGFTVLEADDGLEGLKIIEREKPEVILLDLMMPRMSGDQMLRELRAYEWGENIPVIILTNISKDEVPRTLWHLGISSFIVKANSTPQKVVDAVHEALTQNA